MYITLHPQSKPETIALERQGDTLFVNGDAFDFSQVTEGATLPTEAIDSEWFSGPVTRQGGELRLTVVLPLGPGAPKEMRFPEPIIVTQDGPIALPAHEDAREDVQ